MMKFFRYIGMISLLFSLHSGLYAQNTNSILDKRLSLKVKNLPFKDVLDRISKETGVDFSYSDDLVLLPKKVSIDANDKPLRFILDQLLQGCSVSYKVIGNQIVFQSAKKISKKVTISGYVSDIKTGERLIFATVYDTISKAGVSTNEYGFYSITLPQGYTSLKFSYVGFFQQLNTALLRNDTIVNVRLVPNNELKEVVITSSQGNVDNTKMSFEKIPMKDIKTLPSFLGESDIIKTIQMSPGVKGKEFSNFYVRGGYHDQNLVLLDDAVIYKYSHLGGFYSVFNSDALKSVDLYKGIAPASYGGRLSSVLDVRMRDGNNQSYNVSGALGLLFSHLTVEGPIIKDKMSFICSARRSYFDIFFPLASSASARDNKAFFFDINAKLNYTISQNDRLYLSFFNSNDEFSLSNGGDDRSGMFYHSRTASLRYNHVFNSRLFSNLTLTNTFFDYGNKYKEIDALNQETNTGSWKGNLTDYGLKNDYTWYYNPSNTFQFGGIATLHRIEVGSKFSTETAIGVESGEAPLPKINSLENALYAASTHRFSDKLSMEYGLRLSMHSNVGKSFYYKYIKNDFGGIGLIDTVYYRKGEFYNTHFFLEPRISFCYNLNSNSSVKVGYNRHTQNIHLITNTTISTPFDIWYPTTLKIKPQLSDIVSAGYFLDFGKKKYSISVEVYYKKMRHVVDIKDHAQLFGNPFFEDELAFGNARSYGVEVNVRKNVGAFTGWLAYTYSRAFMKAPGINNGFEYPATFDVPHDFSLGLIYKAGKRVTLSANWMYSSGAATMLIAGSYRYMNLDVPYYTGKNQGRLPDYHRLDFAMNVITKRSIRQQAEGKKHQASWNFSLINVYNRKNPYYNTIKPDYDNPSVTVAEKVYFYGFFPSVSYSFKF